MEKKINIAELLKDCPKGMELDCILFSNPVKYGGLDNDDDCSITIYTETGTCFYLTKEGYLYNAPNSKCIIFPKGKTTWEGFQRPFKDGDVLVHTQNDRFVMSIYKSNESETIINTYAIFWDRGEGLSVGMQICCYTDSTRLATKDEKEKLFQAIKANGYKWNAETKTLEKLIEPKFKVGDRIKRKNGYYVIEIIKITEDGHYNFKDSNGEISYFNIEYQDNYELVPNKFDITTLKPFDKVLVRGDVGQKWTPDFFGFMDKDKECPFVCVGHYVSQCVPYENNEHLLGKTDDCDDFYKTWEK